MSGPGPYGPGRRSEPREVPGGRREVPFGPDISWPNGFRQLDQEARRLLESGYSTPGYGRSQHDHADPGYGTGRGSGHRSADPYPPADDYGSAFSTLAAHGRIDAELASGMRQAAGLRNLIAHGYASIDPARVYDEGREGIPGIRRFLDAVARRAGL